MVSSVRRGPAIENLGDAIAWVRARPWLYAYVVLFLYALVPGVRRVIDWRSSFSSVSLVSILPLISLVPAAAVFFYTARGRKLSRSMLTAAWLWTGGFVYAYGIGIASGNAPAATYTFLAFMLPMAFGLLVATFDVPMGVVYDRIAGFSLALAVPVSLYAFYQFAAPPPWDIYWIQQTGLVSVGTAAAFAFRPFATLNGPGAFADFLVCVLILNLPRLRGANFFRYSAIFVTLAALGLSLVRADWLAFAIAVLVYVGLGPRKLQNLSTIAVIGIVLALLGANAGSLTGNEQVGSGIQSRFESLFSIGTDTSFIDRQVLFGNALATAFQQPTGEGLGVTGTAAKLGASGTTADFDNGYIARFTEMGYFGMLAYVGTLLTMLVLSLRRWWNLTKAGDAPSAAIVAAAIGMQVMLALLDVSGDHHAQFAGVFLWVSYAFVFGTNAGNE